MTHQLTVIGASGFVGSSLAELLKNHPDLETKLLVHGSGRAARLARGNFDFLAVDILDKRQLGAALKGSDFVVNCTRGGADVMLKGLDNIIDACKETGVQRLVHLSSVAVYGDPPHPESATEDAPTLPAKGSYGELKLNQDVKVQAAAKSGLSTVILCPPNITGPYSDYVTDIIYSLESGRFRLLDDGEKPINVVDVRNLSAAIVSAFGSGAGNGQRFFICDAEQVSWKAIYTELSPLLRCSPKNLFISSEKFRDIYSSSGPKPPKPQGGAIRHLASDDVRRALRAHPRWAAVEKILRRAVARMGPQVEDRLREKLVGPVHVAKMSLSPELDVSLIAQQLREVRHSIEHARTELKYSPTYSVEKSFADFRDWYGAYCAVGTHEYALLANR